MKDAKAGKRFPRIQDYVREFWLETREIHAPPHIAMSVLFEISLKIDAGIIDA